MGYAVSPEVFFLVENGQVLMFNCRTHEQFLLKEPYFKAILDVSESGSSGRLDVLEDIARAGVIQNGESAAMKWPWDPVSLLFHSGTRNVPSIKLDSKPDEFAKQYRKECEDIKKDVPEFFQDKPGESVSLPKPSLDLNDMRIGEVLQKRKTSRDFDGGTVSLQQVSDLLYSSFGLIHGEWDELNDQGLKIAGVRKSSPSSGGLHAEEAYLAAFRVEGLAPGLYYYRPQDHQLTCLKSGDFESEIIEMNQAQFYAQGAAFGVYVTARLDKYGWKYQHSRTYRVMLMDMGHVSQTFLLSATALGLQTWLTGVFKDAEVEAFLGVDGYRESVMLYLSAGTGTDAAFGPAFLGQSGN